MVIQHYAQNYKKKWNVIQKQSSCKKSAAPKKAIVKKDVKSKVVAKKWLWLYVNSKILVMTIQEFGAES